jgi:hypothetical protein
MKGPYNLKEVLTKLERLQKNRSYSQSEAADAMGVDRQTVRRMVTLYRPDINHALETAGKPQRIREMRSKVVSDGFKVEGCEYGPLKIIRWPVLPRVKEWIKERPKIRDWLMDHPRV